MFDPAYFDPGYFTEALVARGFPPPSILLTGSPYFTHTYFDPTSFDTDAAPPTTATGGPRRGPRRRPAPVTNDDEFWMVLI